MRIAGNASNYDDLFSAAKMTTEELKENDSLEEMQDCNIQDQDENENRVQIIVTKSGKNDLKSFYNTNDTNPFI